MAERRFTLLYDGECPFCRQEVEWLRRRDGESHLILEDITDPGFDPAKYGLTRDEVAGVLHGILPDGRVVRCVEAIRQAYQAVGLGWARRADAMAGRPPGARRDVRHLRTQSHPLGAVTRKTVRERQYARPWPVSSAGEPTKSARSNGT